MKKDVIIGKDWLEKQLAVKPYVPKVEDTHIFLESRIEKLPEDERIPFLIRWAGNAKAGCHTEARNRDWWQERACRAERLFEEMLNVKPKSSWIIRLWRYFTSKDTR